MATTNWSTEPGTTVIIFPSTSTTTTPRVTTPTTTTTSPTTTTVPPDTTSIPTSTTSQTISSSSSDPSRNIPTSNDLQSSTTVELPSTQTADASHAGTENLKRVLPGAIVGGIIGCLLLILLILLLLRCRKRRSIDGKDHEPATSSVTPFALPGRNPSNGTWYSTPYSDEPSQQAISPHSPSRSQKIRYMPVSGKVPIPHHYDPAPIIRTSGIYDRGAALEHRGDSERGQEATSSSSRSGSNSKEVQELRERIAVLEERERKGLFPNRHPGFAIDDHPPVYVERV